MSGFGELIYESSRAFADDEEEEFQNQSALSFVVKETDEGRKFLEESGGVGIAAFVGKVAVGFGEKISGADAGFCLLAEVKLEGQGDNVVDIYLNRPKQKPVASLYLNKTDKLIVAVFNTQGVPRYLSNEVVESLENYLKSAGQFLIFYSDTLAYYQSNEQGLDRKLFHVTSSKFQARDLLKASSSIPLAPPNVIGGISASLLLHAEKEDKPGVLLATYGESEMLDSISFQPFTNFLKKASGGNGGNFKNMIGSLNKSVDNFLNKCKSNVSPVAIGNLYI